MEALTFSWQDYLVLATVLSVSAATGFYYACTGGKQRTTKEYLHADKNMHWIPVSASVTASYISALTMIGLPGEVYGFGTSVGYLALANPIAVAVALLFIYVFERLNITSVNEYAAMRFGREIRIVCLILGLIDTFVFTAFVVYAPSLAFSAVTELSLWTCVIIISCIGILYTVLGGMKAVLWTDTMQSLIMLTGALTVFITGLISANGFGNVWQVNRLGGRLDFLEPTKAFDFDPRARTTFWNQLISGFLATVQTCGMAQSSLQRRNSLSSRKDTTIAFMVASFGISAFQILGILNGLVIYAYYALCDPIESGRVFSKDQLYPLFVMETYAKYPGVSGLILSAVFSAALSTISTNICSCSTMILQDIVRPFKKNLSDWRATLVSKALCCGAGLFVIGLVAVAQHAGVGIFSAMMTFYNMSAGPYMAVFIVGIFFPVVNRKGLILGILVSCGFVYWIGFGNLIYSPYVYKYPTTVQGCNLTAAPGNVTLPTYDPSTWEPNKHYRSGVESLYDISYAWYSLLGMSLTCIFSIIFSLLIGNKNEPKINHNLLSPLVCNSRCLPSSWKERIQFDEENLRDKENVESEMILDDPTSDRLLVGTEQPAENTAL